MVALLAKRNRKLEEELAERRKAEEALRQANRELGQSKNATLSLREDLKAENEGRKKSEAALRGSEAQRTTILNGITTNIALVDKGLRILSVSKSAAESVCSALLIS